MILYHRIFFFVLSWWHNPQVYIRPRGINFDIYITIYDIFGYYLIFFFGHIITFPLLGVCQELFYCFIIKVKEHMIPFIVCVDINNLFDCVVVQFS